MFFCNLWINICSSTNYIVVGEACHFNQTSHDKRETNLQKRDLEAKVLEMLVLMNVREIHVEGQRNLCWDWARESLNSGLGFYLWEVVAGVKNGDVLTNPSSSRCCSVIQHSILTCSTGKELNAHHMRMIVADLMIQCNDGVGNSAVVSNYYN